jgi:hypothetical protein
MATIYDFPRFKEPDEREPEVVGYCEYCGDPLHEDEELTLCEGDVYCDDYCLLKQLDAERVVGYELK